MPISSGANNWPRTYWSRPPKRPGVHTNVVVVDRPDDPPGDGPVSRPTSARVTYRSPPPSPPPPPSGPPPPSTTITRHVIVRDDDDRPPSPRRRPPSPRTPTPPPSPYRPRTPPTPPPQQKHTTTHVTRTNYVEQPRRPALSKTTRYGEYDDSTRYDSYRNGYRTNNRYNNNNSYSRNNYNNNYYDDGNSRCCGDQNFGSGRAGGETGCCQGGLSSNRRYPYAGSDTFLPGTGSRRCCAMVAGIIAGLLLLGLLIGLLAGLMPALKSQSAQSTVTKQYPNGKMINGVYYYPVTNPPDQFYLWRGPGVPCVVVTAAPAGATTVKPTTVTGSTLRTTTLPNCNRVTTSYVLAVGVSVPTTTLSWAAQFPQSATAGGRPRLSMVAVAVAAIVCRLIQVFG